jgi:hypothetical protein
VSYRLRKLDPRRTARALAGLAVAAAFVVFAGFIDAFGNLALVFLAVFAWSALSDVWRSSLRVRVDQDGVFLRTGAGLDDVSVNWGSIRELVLTVAYLPGAMEARPTRLGVRLADGAGLPSGARAVIVDPNDPDAVSPALDASVADLRLDREALAAAVAANGRRLVEARG